MMSTYPRITPGGRRELGWFGWGVTRIAGLINRTTAPNLFRTLGRHPGLFRGWLHFAGRLMPGGLLSRRETELVILRTAHLCQSQYEFEHHIRLARRVGIAGSDIERVLKGPMANGWTDREYALLVAADALHEHNDLDDSIWQLLTECLDKRECLELILLVGHYQMLAMTIRTLRIASDRPRGRAY